MNKRLPSQKKLTVMNSDSYRYTIEEAALMFRMNRTKFVNRYIKTNKLRVTLDEDGRQMILHSDIKKVNEDEARIYIGEFPRLIQNQEV